MTSTVHSPSRFLMIGLSLSSALSALALAAASFARFGGALHDHREMTRMIESDLLTGSTEIPTWYLVTVALLDITWFLATGLWIVVAATGWAIERRTVPTLYVAIGFFLLGVLPITLHWLPFDPLWLPHALPPVGILLRALVGITALAMAVVALLNMRTGRSTMSWLPTTPFAPLAEPEDLRTARSSSPGA
ncbi:hypothetical protein [Nocardioides sp.]|uniref:hypothetical protein n=1 Tax=Nocardioides sp. TaxID=35761 RepID=UPI002CC30E77|nr:hypothetical protein [Nocardioides sp.]HSX69055.1 hypothetical protein [Nocardioides sp.]